MPAAAQAEKRTRALWAAAGAALFVAYAFTWWTSYCAPNSGNELFVMSMASHGKMPYRDYYWVQPPAIPMMFIASQKIFGTVLYPFFAFSLLSRAVAAVALAMTLSVRRNAVVSGLLSAIAMIVSCNDDGEVIDHYMHWTSTWAVLGMAGAYPWVVRREDAFMTLRAHAALAGVSAGMLVMTKQTAALYVLLVMLALGAIAFLDSSRRKSIGTLIGVAVAVSLVPVVGCLLWLAKLGAVRAYLDDCYFVGARAKGSPSEVFTRFFTAPFHFPELGRAAAVALALVVLIWGFLALRRALEQGRTRPAAQGGAALLAVGLALYMAYSASTTSDGSTLVVLARSSIYGGIFGCAIFAAWLGVRLLRGARDDDTLHGFFLSFSALSLAYSMAGSWGAMEFMSFPALAIASSELIARVDDLPGGREVRGVAAAALLVWVVVCARWRYHSPYRWSYWYEPPVAEAEYRSRQPALWGFNMSHSTAAFVDSVTDIVQDASDPGEPVLQFPHLLLVPALADRPPFGFAPMLFFDVCTDACARGEAERLLQTPPPVVVYQDYPDSTLALQEVIWRGEIGGSGQRELLGAIRSLLKSGQYTDVQDFKDNGIPVRALVRSDRVSRIPPLSPSAPANERR